MERMSDTGSGILIVYGIVITFVQVWITREAFEQVGITATMPIANSLSVYLQGILVGLGVLLGLLFLILPGLYVFARWYLASARSEEHTSELQSLMSISYAGFC